VSGRRFGAQRPIRLSDTDAKGRLRLDAIARYLQDVASDDWEDAGLASDESAWVVRKTWIDVDETFASDASVELETWCSGIAAAAASRRYSLRGDAGGRVEAESVWIHLDSGLRPLRLPQRFRETFGESADGRGVETRFTLVGPAGAGETPWPLRTTDIDRLGHVNNAVYWALAEERWGGLTGRFVLEYRKPVDRSDDARVAATDGALWLLVSGEVRAAAAILPGS